MVTCKLSGVPARATAGRYGVGGYQGIHFTPSHSVRPAVA